MKTCRVPISVDYNENWEATFLAGLVNEETSDDEEDEENDEDPEPAVHKFNNFKEIITSLDDIKLFLDNRGLIEEATATSNLIDAVSCAHLGKAKQATILDYFNSTIHLN